MSNWKTRGRNWGAWSAIAFVALVASGCKIGSGNAEVKTERARGLKHPLKSEPDDVRVRFYIDRLNDKGYVEKAEDGESALWYTAAEELGLIGRPALPQLFKKLGETDNVEERTMLFYALRLAVQHPNSKEAFGDDWPRGEGMAFPAADTHDQLRREWLKWWQKVGS